MYEFVDLTIDSAEKQGSLNYFEMKIINHQGQLQLENTYKNREKAY
jgi:hypothetical protein